MEIEIFTGEATKIWERIAGGSAPDLLSKELELYKKLLTFSQVGDYYYYIFNFKHLQFDFVSKEIEAVLGYDPAEVTIEFIMDKMHPDDRPWFLQFQNRSSEFLAQLPRYKLMKYKSQFDCRFKKKNGDYTRLLHQSVVIQTDDDGGLIRTLILHTDISHFKKEGRPVMSYIGMDDEPSYMNIDISNLFVENKEALSRREKEILKLLIEGKLSKEIGAVLNISKQTVDTHRKNMLHKNKLNSTGELIGKAIRNGWL